MPGRKLPADVRFWALTDKPADPNACWNWKGYKLPNGWPRFSYKLKAVYAHHYSWFLHHGEWQRFVTRTCDNNGCVNPAHMVASKNKRKLHRAKSK
jgi:hypothetical protein